MICKEKSGSWKDWNTKIIRVFDNANVYWVKFKSNCGCYIFMQYNLPFFGGSDTPQGKKNSCSNLDYHTSFSSKHIFQDSSVHWDLWKLPTSFHFPFPSSFSIRSDFSWKKTIGRKGTVKPFGSHNQTSVGGWGVVF